METRRFLERCTPQNENSFTEGGPYDKPMKLWPPSYATLNRYTPDSVRPEP
jgi:hypothetical protein